MNKQVKAAIEACCVAYRNRLEAQARLENILTIRGTAEEFQRASAAYSAAIVTNDVAEVALREALSAERWDFDHRNAGGT